MGRTVGGLRTRRGLPGKGRGRVGLGGERWSAAVPGCGRVGGVGASAIPATGKAVRGCFCLAL